MLINKQIIPYPLIIAHFSAKVNTFYAFLSKLNNFSVQNVVKFTTKFLSKLSATHRKVDRSIAYPFLKGLPEATAEDERRKPVTTGSTDATRRKAVGNTPKTIADKSLCLEIHSCAQARRVSLMQKRVHSACAF